MLTLYTYGEGGGVVGMLQTSSIRLKNSVYMFTDY